MVPVVTENDFINIHNHLNHVWTKDLPFNATYRSVLMERLHTLKILDKSDFCYPTKIIEVMGTKKFNDEIPETTRRILVKGLLALERQLERQQILYGNIENVFNAGTQKKKELIQINRDEIYKGFRLKMYSGLLFMPTGNKIYNGDFSFKSDVLDDILAHYSTISMLAAGNFSQFDALFIEVPCDYFLRPRKTKRRH